MIKELREQLGLSQREFGKRIGRTGAYISQIESGKIKASPETIAAIEATFNVGESEGSIAERLNLARKSRGYTQERANHLQSLSMILRKNCGYQRTGCGLGPVQWSDLKRWRRSWK